MALGQRLRHLYVDQLQFMPKLIADSDMIYLRATPMPRALESLQQAFWGFYPPSARTAEFPPPTIVTRMHNDETLYPNDVNCRRFSQLSRAFAQRTADRWNEADEMLYLNKLISKWMPESSPRVAVDSKPRLSGIMDTINSTLAHGPATRLPKEFYDAKGRAIIDKIAVEEWFTGYAENREYRALGIGALMGDVTTRMIGSVEQKGSDGLSEIGGEDGNLGQGKGGKKAIKFAISGCHDTTLAGVLTSLGAFGGEYWPPYTSHVAFELFRRTGLMTSNAPPRIQEKLDTRQGWFASLFGSAKSPSKPDGISRRTVDQLTPAEKSSLEGYFVRLRYNDKIMRVPGCAFPGKHLDGDESFCTLVCLYTVRIPNHGDTDEGVGSVQSYRG